MTTTTRRAGHAEHVLGYTDEAMRLLVQGPGPTGHVHGVDSDRP